MAGYHGYSMSNNAVEAYQDGERPLSKWTKTEILSRIRRAIKDEEIELKCSFDKLNKLPVKTLKNELLCVSSWHHTSSHFNRTDFYDIWWDKLEHLTDEEIDGWTTIKEDKPQKEKWLCKFLEWSGSRRHPKATEYTEEGIIKGNWFYRANGSKKSITANGFQKIKKVN